MTIEKIELNAQPRDRLKNSSKKLSGQNRVPAIIYGPKTKNMMISIKSQDALKYSKKEFDNRIFTLQSENSELNGLQVLKKHVSYDRVSKKPIHLDLFSIDTSAKVRVMVALQFEGQPKGVKEEGGVFSVTKRDIEIECLASAIPSFISVDTTELRLGKSLHVSDLIIPNEVKLITRPEQTICLVTEAMEEIVSTPTTPTAEEKSDETAAAGTPEESENKEKGDEQPKKEEASSEEKK